MKVNDDFKSVFCSTYDQALYIQHLINFEIFNNLPRLEEKELKARENAIKEIVFKKDRLKDYYEYIKKKYTNFIQLAYVDDELLHEFYSYQLIYDKYKTKFNISFDFLKTLYGYYRGNNMNEEVFKKTVVNRLAGLNVVCEGIYNSDNLWNHISIDEKFLVNINDKNGSKSNIGERVNENQILVDLVKYNPDYSASSDSVFLNIKLIYPELTNDLSSILFHRKEITQLIIEFAPSLKYWDTKLNQTTDDGNEEKYSLYVNKILAVILNNLNSNRSRNIHSLLLISNLPKFNSVLNEENSKMLVNLLNKGYDLNLLVIKNISLDGKVKSDFIGAIFNSRSLRYLHIEGENYGDNDLKAFSDNFNNTQKVCYVSFDNEHTFENMYGEDSTTPEKDA